jgi:hypothetical protein
MSQDLSAFWTLTAEAVLKQLSTGPEGLTEDEAQKRLKDYGSNLLRQRKESNDILLPLSQFKSPIILLLVFAAMLSIYLHQHMEAGIILAIIFVSGLLGFWQERRAADAVARLLALVQIKANVLRDERELEIPVEDVVPTSNPQVIEAFIWIAILTLLISRRIYKIVCRLNPRARMARFTQLRWSNVFSESANNILTAVLQFLGLDTSLITVFKISMSEALDPHANRRRFTEEWWA